MNYDVKHATSEDLEHLLRSAPAGSTVIAIVPFGTTGNEYLVVFKRD